MNVFAKQNGAFNFLQEFCQKNRSMQTRPFENIGIDYCGPFLLKVNKFRNRITVILDVVVFVCFTTKAFRINADLTTESCLIAFKRLFCCRGKPKNIYSDNAANFIGAKNATLTSQTTLAFTEYNKKYDLSNQGVN